MPPSFSSSSSLLLSLSASESSSAVGAGNKLRLFPDILDSLKIPIEFHEAFSAYKTKVTTIQPNRPKELNLHHKFSFPCEQNMLKTTLLKQITASS